MTKHYAQLWNSLKFWKPKQKKKRGISTKYTFLKKEIEYTNFSEKKAFSCWKSSDSKVGWSSAFIRFRCGIIYLKKVFWCLKKKNELFHFTNKKQKANKINN